MQGVKKIFKNKEEVWDKKENRISTNEDIYKAFDLGLDTGLYALEKSIDHPTEEQEYLLEYLKRMVSSESES